MPSRTPSPEYAAGLLTALDRECPVCHALPRAGCTTAVTMRPAHGTKGEPQPIILTGPHFERVMGT